MFFSKPVDYEEEIKKKAEKVGVYAQIDWFELDHALGTHVKRIFIYKGTKIIGTLPFNKIYIDELKKDIPVVDMTKGRPYPIEFEKMPRKVAVMGRFNLIDLNI